MPDVLANGLKYLADQLHDHAAELVTYVRGGDSVQLKATFGRKLLRLESPDGGVRMEWTDMDFLIRASDLVIGGRALRPARGDQVIVNANGQIQTYEVLPYGNEPPWRWSDPFQHMMRVHTKCITKQTAYFTPPGP